MRSISLIENETDDHINYRGANVIEQSDQSPLRCSSLPIGHPTEINKTIESDLFKKYTEIERVTEIKQFTGSTQNTENENSQTVSPMLWGSESPLRTLAQRSHEIPHADNLLPALSLS